MCATTPTRRRSLDLQTGGFRVLAAVEQDNVHCLATARRVAPGGTERGVVIDLLFASSGIEPEVARGADAIEVLAGLRIPVARIGHLMALKLLARDDRRRPQDLDDLRSLLRESTEADLVEPDRPCAQSRPADTIGSDSWRSRSKRSCERKTTRRRDWRRCVGRSARSPATGEVERRRLRQAVTRRCTRAYGAKVTWNK